MRIAKWLRKRKQEYVELKFSTMLVHGYMLQCRAVKINSAFQGNGIFFIMSFL